MLTKSATILCLLAVAQAASIQQRNIPVEVKYEEGASTTGANNLDGNVQELTTITEAATEESEPKPIAIRNLDEKVQLSIDDLAQASKHLPVVEEISLKDLGEVRKIELVTQAPEASGIQGLLQQAEDVIFSGLKKLRSSFKAGKDEKAPNPQQWDELEKAVNEYLLQEKSKLQLRQQTGQPPQNQNIFQNIAQGFQQVANNFMQNIIGQNSNSTEDEQQGGQGNNPFQGFVNFFQNGINNVVESVNGLGNQGPTTSNTVLGDTGSSTTQAPNLVSSFVSNVQQFIGQISGAAQGGSSAGAQGDTGTNSTSSSSVQGPGQIIQTIGSAINNFIQGRPPNTSGDEGSGSTTERNPNIIQSIGNVIQNSPLNPFRPPSQQGGAGEASTSNPVQTGIQGVQSIGNQIQQLIPGQGSTSEAPKVESQVIVEQSNQAPAGAINQADSEVPKEVELVSEQSEPSTQAPVQENTSQKEEQEAQQDVQQDELEEEVVQDDVKQEEKAEEIKKLMEEQVKKEETKEELRQEKMKEKAEVQITKTEEKNEKEEVVEQKNEEQKLGTEQKIETPQQNETEQKKDTGEKKEEILMTAE